MPRRVIYHPDFDADCAILGGIAAVQEVIVPLVQSLEDGDPSVFNFLDLATNKRYAPIRAIGNMPALIVVFSMDEDDDAIMQRVIKR